MNPTHSRGRTRLFDQKRKLPQHRKEPFLAKPGSRVIAAPALTLFVTGAVRRRTGARSPGRAALTGAGGDGDAPRTTRGTEVRMDALMGMALGFVAWFVVRYGIFGLFTVNQSERAVKTSFGRAERIPGKTSADLPEAALLSDDERRRYAYPQLRVIGPGGPYFKWPWEKLFKVSVATETVSMAFDPENPHANHSGQLLEAVTKDQLNTGLRGQIRYRVCESNLYAYLFGVKSPIAHVMGYFVAVLRQRVASFEAPRAASQLQEGSLEASAVSGVSINDLRKNMRDLNEHMDRECRSSMVRYGIQLDASLITEIDPPSEVESALAAINTAHNHVSSDISLAQAAADQKIVQSRRAVEIETLRAQAEVEPLVALATQLAELKRNGPDALPAYLRNLKLGLFAKAKNLILEVK
jgi:regulator of protease activity HflC (stomatin/prohibitin superfamily)